MNHVVNSRLVPAPLLVILEGQLEIDFNGKLISFGPGDGIFIPPGEQHEHKGRAITETVKLILVEDA
ncbi:MAG: cupin domain-containing protein [Phycisphaerae bacterium]|nr:cupin domain-containing protein [Phycisphaerae bacterium]